MVMKSPERFAVRRRCLPVLLAAFSAQVRVHYTRFDRTFPTKDAPQFLQA